MELVLNNGGIHPESFLRHFDSFWTGGSPFATSTSAAADVVEDTDGYHLYVEMPGVKSESLDLKVEDGLLVIEAERKRPEWAKEASVHLSERRYGAMRRTFAMPEDANAGSISASFRDGVLEISIPKKPESKPLKIKVNVEK